MLIESEDQVGVAGEEEEEEEILLEPKEVLNQTEPERSLHVMEGDSSPRTIRLLGQVNKKTVSILLDTGSTHNFIDPNVVHRGGLQVVPEPSFNVTVAGGDKLHGEDPCKSMQVKCQGVSIMIDFHVLPIGAVR